MTGSWDVVAIAVGVTTTAIAGGTFFTFSNYVMPALSTLTDTSGAKAMQAINRAAPNPLFIATLLLGVFAGVPVLVAELDALVGAAVALSALSLAITLTRNVPKNDRLEAVDADSVAGSTYWQTYVPTWTLDNTLRGLASLSSALMYALSLRGR